MWTMSKHVEEDSCNDTLWWGESIGSQAFGITCDSSTLKVGASTNIMAQSRTAETTHQTNENVLNVDTSAARGISYIVHGALGPAGHPLLGRKERGLSASGELLFFPQANENV